MSQKAKEIELSSLVAVLDQLANNGRWVREWPKAESPNGRSRSVLNNNGGLTIYGRYQENNDIYIAIDIYPHKSMIWLITRFDIVTTCKMTILTPTDFYNHINKNPANLKDLDRGDLSSFWTISSARDLLKFFEEYNKAARFLRCPELFVL